MVSRPPARSFSSSGPPQPPRAAGAAGIRGPPAPGSLGSPGRQLSRQPPLHHSPTSTPGGGHARPSPTRASPLPGLRAGEGARGGVGTGTHQVGAHRALRQHQGALGHQEDFDVGEAGHLLFLLLVPLSLVPLQLAAPAAARRAARLLPLHPSPAAASAALPLAPSAGPLPGAGARREAACCPHPGPAAAAPVLPGLER